MARTTDQSLVSPFEGRRTRARNRNIPRRAGVMTPDVPITPRFQAVQLRAPGTFRSTSNLSPTGAPATAHLRVNWVPSGPEVGVAMTGTRSFPLIGWKAHRNGYWPAPGGAGALAEAWGTIGPVLKSWSPEVSRAEWLTNPWLANWTPWPWARFAGFPLKNVLSVMTR